MDIYINLDALDLKTAAVVSKDDLRSKPLKELVAGENQVINLYTTAKTGSPNIQDYSTVRVGIGNINAVPTSGSYTVTYGTKTEFISFNELSSSIAAKFYNLTDAQIGGVTTIAPQTYKIDFQYTGSVAVPSITGDTDLYPASTVTISELSVGSATTKASWLLKTNQDALALTSTFTNISPQGISGVLNTATTGIYEKLQSSKFFKTTLEVEVVDSASRLSTILQVPISVKGEVIGLSVEPPHATPSPYALVTYVDSKTAANASSITTNTTAISGHTTDINSLNDGEQINSAGISANTTNITANTTTISGHTTDINALYDGEQINGENIATNLASISSLDSLKAPKASPTFTGDVTAPRVITNEIQAYTGSPVTYDSAEHRFRDFDETPNNLMVIKKTAGVVIGKVGINHNNPKCALHVVGGHSTGGMADEAIRVVGAGLFTSDNETSLVIAMDTDNTASTSNPILKIKRDEREASTGNVESMNLGFVGSDALYGSQTLNAGYIQVEGGRKFEIATGATPNRRLEVSDTGIDVTGNLEVSGFTQFGSLTTTARDALTASNGMVIYNSTLNKFQGYENGAWVNLV